MVTFATQILSHIDVVQLFKTSSSLWWAPPWEGGWLWYPFFIYMIIYDLTWYLIFCSIWTGNNCYWDKKIAYILTKALSKRNFLVSESVPSRWGVVLIEDIEPNLPTLFISQGEESRWRAPRVERTLDNRGLPLSVTYRARVVAHPMLVFSEYTPVGIIPTSWACWECRSSSGQWDESVLGGVQPKAIMMQVFYHMTRSSMGRSVGNMMGWDDPIWFWVEGKAPRWNSRVEHLLPYVMSYPLLDICGSYCSPMWFQVNMFSLMIFSLTKTFQEAARW